MIPFQYYGYYKNALICIGYIAGLDVLIVWKNGLSGKKDMLDASVVCTH